MALTKQFRQFSDGFVVIFEGLDGVGKTTQLNLAKEALESQGWSVHATRNLGGSPIGEALRQVILSPLPRPALTDLYIGAAIQEALAIEVSEKRHQGQIVLIDRGPISFAAYPSYGGNLDKTTAWLHADKGYTSFKPDLIIFYNLSIDKAIQRSATRNKAKDYFENKSRPYLKRVLAGLEAGVARYGAVKLSADDSVANIHEATMRLIEERLVQVN